MLYLFGAKHFLQGELKNCSGTDAWRPMKEHFWSQQEQVEAGLQGVKELWR
jgi:hypothetical protein